MSWDNFLLHTPKNYSPIIPLVLMESPPQNKRLNSQKRHPGEILAARRLSRSCSGEIAHIFIREILHSF